MSKSNESTIRKLRKKLRQIETLEKMERTLTEEEELKIDAKEDIRSELHKLVKFQESMTALTKEVDHSVITTLVEKSANAKSNSICKNKQEPKVVQSESSTDNHINDVGYVISYAIDASAQNNFDVADVIDNQTIEKKITNEKNEKTTDLTEPNSEPISKVKKMSGKIKNKCNSGTVQNSSKLNLSETIFKDLSFKLTLLEGHHDDICAIDVFGDIVISGGRDTSLKLWCLKKNEEIKSFGGHNGTVTGIRFLVDKEYTNYPNVITSSYDCTLRVWDLEEGKILRSIYVYSPVVCIDYQKNTVSVGTEAGKLELYDTDSGENLFSVNAYDAPVSAIKILPDRRVAVGSSTGILKVYNTLCKEFDVEKDVFSVDHSIKINQLSFCNNATNQLLNFSNISCISCYNDLVFYGDEGYNIKMINCTKGELCKVRNNVKEFCPTEVLEVAKIQDQEYLFSVGLDVDNGDGYVNIRTLPDLKYMGTIHDSVNNSGTIKCIRIEEVDSGFRLITGGSQLRVWNQIKTKNTRKRKGSVEDTLIPCKYICSYNDIKDSEPESDLEESQSIPSVQSSCSENHPVGQKWCVIL
ncbi:uncharacterized protein LOC100214037 isoform X1 [Hydra vulgaris]|uniref:Uncharacterized protein LOC100214037 isoform X1 n=2 Tax=Hydra vulgaris TaxID=6087 RepID=A0ABM4C4G0_HYDVU